MTIPDSIPAPVRRFIEATNSGDSEALLETFAPNAMVSDLVRSFLGRDEISNWNQSDNIGIQANLRIVRVLVVDARICGVRMAVKGNGVNGEDDMIFRLDGDRISSLRIG